MLENFRHLDVKVDVEGQGRFGEDVALEEGQEAVQLARGAALVEVSAACAQQHAHQPHLQQPHCWDRFMQRRRTHSGQRAGMPSLFSVSQNRRTS